ncbi:hypothetical protein ACFV6F_05875 [Kitasatospora phosalacinea]|uniref:hypothetical protein n=1 Tax=Kitasatospora phosalacinea TaxID=2065 RepID=UPI003661CCE8
MSRTTSVRRAARLALVPAVVAGVLALPGAVAFADAASPAPASPAPTASASVADPAAPSAVPTPAADPVAPTGGVPQSVQGSGAGPVNGSVDSAAGGPGSLPRGGAQTGEGAVDRGSATGLVVGGGLAAAGAAGVGLLVVRRRADARA